MSAGGGDEQVAQWTRMLEAGTLTEAGYLAMVTTYAKAAFDSQAAAEALPVVVGEQVVAVAAAEASQQPSEGESGPAPAEEEETASSSSEEEDDAEWRPGRQGSKKGAAAGLGAAKTCVTIVSAAAATR